MSVSTVHGRVLVRPGSMQSMEPLLLKTNLVSASGIDLLIPANAVHRFNAFLFHWWGLEKPSGAAAAYRILISTNGASYESAAAYGSVLTGNSATSAAVATGFAGATIWQTVGGTFSLATASGNPSEIFVVLHGAATGLKPHVNYEHYFSNSASSPSHFIGSGFFASSPALGLMVDITNAATGFSGSGAIYGFG